eukprot:Sspe_Gene.57776::Locus_31704_Transcript_2_2_Confidence_0.800_Length_1930::g.57776::m.57776
MVGRPTVPSNTKGTGKGERVEVATQRRPVSSAMTGRRYLSSSSPVWSDIDEASGYRSTQEALSTPTAWEGDTTASLTEAEMIRSLRDAGGGSARTHPPLKRVPSPRLPRRWYPCFFFLAHMVMYLAVTRLAISSSTRESVLG